MLRSLFISSSLVLIVAAQIVSAADTRGFIEQHCFDCHDAESKKGGLDLSALALKLDDRANFAAWVKVHDRIASGEMPPKKKARPPAGATRALLGELDAQLTAVDAARVAKEGRVRMRRMTRAEFENTLVDLFALPRLDVQALLPPDGTVAGFDKIAGALEVSPAHLAAYADAVEKALDAAIVTRSTPPPVFQRRIYPAGLFKFEFNLSLGQYVLLKDKTPDPALPVRGGVRNLFVLRLADRKEQPLTDVPAGHAAMHAYWQPLPPTK